MKCFVFRLLAVALLLCTTCGGRRLSAGVEKPPTWNYKDRRIEGRETAIPWPGVVVHADWQTKLATGVVQLEGRVYVDATEWKQECPFSRFYCQKAMWDAKNQLLWLYGMPVAEVEGKRHWEATLASTFFSLDEGGKFMVWGTSKTTDIVEKP
jgi:hypothetical protein